MTPKFQLCPECKEKWNAYYREWRVKNRDSYLAKKREYAHTHRDKIKEYAKKHREKVKEMKSHERQSPTSGKK